jgi:SulP family sulfate permease
VKLPVFTWLQGYDRGWIRGDIIAGLTVWAVLVPEALAYATIDALRAESHDDDADQ